MNSSTKILIVDDNVIYRKMLVRAIKDMNGVELITPAPNGRTALARLQNNKIDLVLLDMQMPEMDGLETLQLISEKHPDVGVIMISGEFESDAQVVIKALQMGAIDFLPKIPSDPGDDLIKTLKSQLSSLMHQCQGRKSLRYAKQLAGGNRPCSSRSLSQITGNGKERLDAEVEKSPEALFSKTPFVPQRRVRPSRIDVVVVGVSTGGPNALNKIIPELPEDLGVPVLIVQHMPAFLTHSLAQSMDIKSVLRVKEAVDGEMLLPNTVYVAAGGKHLIVQNMIPNEETPLQRVIRLTENPPENSVRPSADVLFRSVAETFDGHILAVIMTGMGNDGMKGVQAMKEKGCYCLTQAEETCVVYGMPRSVDEAGLSDEQVALEDLAPRIIELVKGASKRRSR